jgi:proteasome assembly chaperone (PAC2) family protein
MSSDKRMWDRWKDWRFEDKATLSEQTAQQLADAMTRYLIEDSKAAVRQLAALSSKIDIEVDQDNYNKQYGDTHRAILKVLKGIM